MKSECFLQMIFNRISSTSNLFVTHRFGFYRFVANLPRNVRLEIDPTVNEQMKSDNRKLSFFKEHKGKFHQKIELPKKLEEILNTVISGKNDCFSVECPDG